MCSLSSEGRRQDDNRLYAEFSHYDIDDPNQASFMLYLIWMPRFQLPECIQMLKDDKKLYKKLRASHRIGKYDKIRNWALRHIPYSNANTNAQVLREDIVSAFLASMKPNIALLVRGELNIPIWTPLESLMSRLDDQTISHLTNLRLPCLRGKPNLLLHELGYFAREPNLQKRVRNVFMPESPSHTILINTSGSGKTRLLLEGLCQNWGLYFTTLVDSSHLGSNDIGHGIQTTIPNDPCFCASLPRLDYESKLARNEKLAGRIFKRVFLARMLIFDLFIEIMQDRVGTSDLSVDEYKRRWLLLQIQPSILNSETLDVFHSLTHELLTYSDDYVETKISKVLDRIMSALSPSCMSSTSTSISSTTPLYCVIDEAQFAATKHTSAFRSSRPKDTIPRPVLRPLIQTISALTVGRSVSLILAGTGLSQSSVDAIVASAVMKESRYRWCSDTGSFEGWDGMSAWVRRFIPDWVLDGHRGEVLKGRMGYWLNGRHRFAAGYVTELLAHGFRQPHRLLNAYIKQFTGFDPSDGHEAVLEEEQEKLENLSLSTRYKLDFYRLAERNSMMSTIHTLTIRYVMRSDLPGPLGEDEALYVEYGFARFKHLDEDSSRESRSRTRTASASAVMDEPLVLIAAYRWIDKKHITNYSYFTKQIEFHHSSSNGFENFIVYCIDLLFAKSRELKDVFIFHGTAPPWANLEAKLVSLYTVPAPPESSMVETVPDTELATVRHACFEGPSASLGMNATEPGITLKWLEHGSRAPICFPGPEMGPDAIFVLRLKGGKLLWVVLQAKMSFKAKVLDKELVKKAVRSVTPKNFFIKRNGMQHSPKSYPNLVQDTLSRLEALPNKCEGAGKYSLLRVVVSFPARADLRRCVDKEDVDAMANLEDIEDGHPIAVLNMDRVKQVTRGKTPFDFLHKLELKRGGNKMAGLKRKQSSSSVGKGGNLGKRRKTNLN